MLQKNKNQHWVHHYTKTYKSENKTKEKKKKTHKNGRGSKR